MFGFVSRYGNDLLRQPDPRPGETVLDLGCGTGHQAAEIATLGAHVVGLDADPQMPAKARVDHPTVTFVEGNGTAFGLREVPVAGPFDACFSNAALHWMTVQDAVPRNVRSVLVEFGRLFAEMGGAENIAALDSSLRAGRAAIGPTAR